MTSVSHCGTHTEFQHSGGGREERQWFEANVSYVMDRSYLL